LPKVRSLAKNRYKFCQKKKVLPREKKINLEGILVLPKEKKLTKKIYKFCQ